MLLFFQKLALFIFIAGASCNLDLVSSLLMRKRNKSKLFLWYYTTLCHKCCQLSLTRIEPFKASFKIITDLVTTLNRFGTPWQSPSFRSHAVCFNLVRLFSNSSHVWKVSRGNWSDTSKPVNITQTMDIRRLCSDVNLSLFDIKIIISTFTVSDSTFQYYDTSHEKDVDRYASCVH